MGHGERLNKHVIGILKGMGGVERERDWDWEREQERSNSWRNNGEEFSKSMKDSKILYQIKVE